MNLTNLGLVEHCKKALNEGWGYCYGTYGKMLTEPSLLNRMSQYPNNIKKYETFIRKNWIGKRTVDCVGLIKSYLWWANNDVVYTPKTDLSANGMYNAATVKGEISTIPEVIGLCVRKDQHIGVYIGNGQVIESKGTKYGVVQTPLHGLGANSWTHWLKCPFIEYIEPQATFEQDLKTVADTVDTPYDYWLKKSSKDSSVKGLIVKFANYIKEVEK